VLEMVVEEIKTELMEPEDLETTLKPLQPRQLEKVEQQLPVVPEDLQQNHAEAPEVLVLPFRGALAELIIRRQIILAARAAEAVTMVAVVVVEAGLAQANQLPRHWLLHLAAAAVLDTFILPEHQP
jgi:hypothetical protein